MRGAGHYVSYVSESQADMMSEHPIHLMSAQELADAIEATEVALANTPTESFDYAVLRTQLGDLDREQGNRRAVNGGE